MTFEQKLVLAALIRGLPYVVIIVSAGIVAAKRKSIAAALLALGCAGVAAKDIWSIFAPIWMRAYSIQDYSIINTRFSVCSVAGLYLLSIALAVILLRRGKMSDNRMPEDTARKLADPQH